MKRVNPASLAKPSGFSHATVATGTTVFLAGQTGLNLEGHIVDMDDYRARAGEIGEVWRRLVGTDYPAMAGIGVSRLWDAEALVEVQGFAVLPEYRT